MSCNYCATASQRAATAVGAPAVEPAWAAGRGANGHCPVCGGWLRKSDRGCTKCDRRNGASVRVIRAGYEREGVAGAARRMAGVLASAHPARSQPVPLRQMVLAQHPDTPVEALEVFAAHSSDPFVRAVARERVRGEGQVTLTRLPGPVATSAPPAGAVLADALARGEELDFARYWRHEFGGGGTITLTNGETLNVGQRFTGSPYVVRKGKAHDKATVGATITPAVDRLKTVEVRGNVVRVEARDGGVGYYDLADRAARCGEGCGRGMCHHQMAAIIAGEMYREDSGMSAGRRELQAQLREEVEKLMKRSPPPTEGVIRSSDAAYAYLKTMEPVQINVETVGGELATRSTPPPAAKKRAGSRRCPRCKRFLRSDGGCTYCERKAAREAGATTKERAAKPRPGASEAPARRGHPLIAGMLDRLGVSPPLPVAADVLAADPAGYEGFPVPAPDPRYQVDAQTADVLQTILRRTGVAWDNARRVAEGRGGAGRRENYPTAMEDRCWGLFGPPGTGKNSLARELAAALGIGYVEVDVRDRTDFQALLCEVVFPKEGDKTYSEVRLGPVGHALHTGNVVCINEIVAADPDAQTALHQVLQDGVIRAPGPEGATTYWPVHPNSIAFLTWNPGTSTEDKPGHALLSRTPSLQMDYPDPGDEARRLAGVMSDYLGEEVKPRDVKRHVNLIRGLRQLHERGELETCPTFREMVSFSKEYYLNGKDRHAAARLFRVLCLQGPGHHDQWRQVENLVDAFQEGTWSI